MVGTRGVAAEVVAANDLQVLEGVNPGLVGPGAAGEAAEGHAVRAAILLPGLRVAAVRVDQLTNIRDTQPGEEKKIN